MEGHNGHSLWANPFPQYWIVTLGHQVLVIVIGKLGRRLFIKLPAFVYIVVLFMPHSYYILSPLRYVFVQWYIVQVKA